MRGRKRYYSPSELNQIARTSHHPKQAKAAAEYIDAGWRCYGTRTLASGEMVVFLSHPAGGCHGVMLPNGRLERNKVGQKRVTWSWGDVRAAGTMDGTIKYDDLERPIQQEV